jgi:hypothetical protein
MSSSTPERPKRGSAHWETSVANAMIVAAGDYPVPLRVPVARAGGRVVSEGEEGQGETMSDVARRTGRTENAVRIKREKMGLPNLESRAWTPEELSQLGTATDARVAERIGRTASAVAQKRIALAIPPAGRNRR